MSNYTAEQFINNYIKDRNVFGEETQYIYNDILGMLNEDFTSMKQPLKYLDNLVGKESGENLNNLQKGLKAASEEGLDSLNNISNNIFEKIFYIYQNYQYFHKKFLLNIINLLLYW